MIGETVSHYRIIEELGRGGMGVVYVAEDVKLGRRVALKALAPEVSGDHERVLRFTREARAASAINHPNIATIYEIDEVDGLTFISMELVEGETLREKVRAGIPSFGEVLDLACQIARALGSAHRAGIVHRDVKPENIVVRPDGLVKVLDFGLAKLLPGADSADQEQTMSLTREGAVMGTVRYMSPEQAQGKPVDARTDVFAAGAVFYEMATGRQAFSGETQLDVLYAIVNAPPAPLPADAEVPMEFQEVLVRALAKRAEDRFADCCELAAALEAIGSGDTRTVVRGRGPLEARRAPLWRRLLVPAAVVVAAFAVAAGVIWMRGADRRASLPDLTYTQLTGDGLTRASAISPDGMYLAYTPMDGEESGLLLKQIDTGSESVLVRRGRHGIRSPVFSPDGTQIYFAMAGPTFSMSADAEYDLYCIPLLGGEPLQVADGVIGRRFAISPDGERLAFKRAAGESTRVCVAGALGANERVIHSEPLSLTVDCCLAWSRDGDAVITTTRDTAAGAVSVISLPVEGGPVAAATDRAWQAVLDLNTPADGSGLLVLGCPVSEERALNINLWHVTSARSEPRQITNDLTNYYQVSSSADGNKLALTFYAAKRMLRVVDSASGGHRDISTDVVANGRVAWSARGPLIANQRVGNRIGIVAVRPGTGESEHIATGVDYVSELDVSPDGNLLVFTSFEGSGDFSLWQVPLDGRAPRPLASDGGNEMAARFSPDGRWVATMHRTAPESPWKVRRRSLETDESLVLSDVSCRWPKVSPDGTRIAAYFLDESTGRFRPGLVSSDGGTPIFLEIPGAYRMLGWCPEGTALTCYRRDGERIAIDDVPLDGGTPRTIAEVAAGPLSITDADWNASGDSLALCLESATFDVTLLQGL